METYTTGLLREKILSKKFIIIPSGKADLETISDGLVEIFNPASFSKWIFCWVQMQLETYTLQYSILPRFKFSKCAVVLASCQDSTVWQSNFRAVPNRLAVKSSGGPNLIIKPTNQFS